MHSGSTILVTGASGFLGSRIVERLVLERHANVRVLLRSLRSASSIATLPVEYRCGDVTDINAVLDAATGCDTVIHCASRIESGVPPKSTSTYLGTMVAARACLEAKARLVHISSAAVYGIPKVQIVDESAAHRPRHRKDTYALAKIAAEADLRVFCRKAGLKAAILQPTMIFGPHSHEWTVTPLAMLQHSNIAMPEADRSVCNAVYVDDVASAAFLAADACDARCESYIVNGKDLLTWSEYLSRHTELGSLGKIVRVSAERLDQLRAEAAKSRSFSRFLVDVVRTEPRLRAAILASGLGGNAYSLIQKYASARMMMAMRAKVLGKQESGPRTVRFARPPELPLRLPPQHFLDLARQSHRFGAGKSAQVLGFAPVHSVDTALPMIRAWAKWSRLVEVRS